MRNPFRSETEAFRAAVGAAVGTGAIAAVWALGGQAAGLGMLGGFAAALLVWLLSRDRVEPGPALARPPAGAAARRRVLVVANETLGGASLDAAVASATAGGAAVHVVCPALNSRLRHWASDDDAALATAHVRLRVSLERLRAAGVEATGEVGDSDPLLAMEDALRTTGADELIISTHPEGRSNWLERGVVERAREQFDLPTAHVVVDLERPLALAAVR